MSFSLNVLLHENLSKITDETYLGTAANYKRSPLKILLANNKERWIYHNNLQNLMVKQ